jgi:hypothetical protein
LARAREWAASGPGLQAAPGEPASSYQVQIGVPSGPGLLRLTFGMLARASRRCASTPPDLADPDRGRETHRHGRTVHLRTIRDDRLVLLARQNVLRRPLDGEEVPTVHSAQPSEGHLAAVVTVTPTFGRIRLVVMLDG